MQIKDVLRSIRDHFAQSRQAGHTSAMLNGTKTTTDVIVLCSTRQHALQLRGMAHPTTAVIPMGEFPSRRMKPMPLVIDNAALHDLCREALTRIEQLESRLEQLQQSKDP